MSNLSSSDLILFLLVLYSLTAVPLIIMVPVMARIRNKNVIREINFLFHYLAIPFFFIIVSFFITEQYPTFFQSIIAFLNKVDFIYLIMPIIFIVIYFISHYRNQVFNDNASRFLKYKTYYFRVSEIIFLFGFYLAFYRIFIGNVAFEIAKIVFYIGIFACSILIFIEMHYKSNIYYILEKLIQSLNQLGSYQQNKRLISEFATDFRTFLNVLDEKLPKNIKINDFDLKSKKDQDLKYTINKYLKIYIIFGTEEQIVSLDKNIKEIKDILLKNEPRDIILVRAKIVNIYNDIDKFLQENEIKQYNNETDTFFNHIKNGRYSEIKNQSFALLTSILLYLLIMFIQMVIAGESESMLEHLNF